MTEMTQDDALRLADVLVSRALKETEARCSVLGQFINDCERTGSASTTTDWTEALRELHELHSRRSALIRRQNLIRQALECPVGDCPARVPLSNQSRAARQTQQQVQIRARRRSSAS